MKMLVTSLGDGEVAVTVNALPATHLPKPRRVITEYKYIPPNVSTRLFYHLPHLSFTKKH